MKYISALLMLVVLIQAFPLAEENPVPKKYDFEFSLSGGTVKGKFSLAGEIVYARQFGGVFTQFAAMTNYRDGVGEYGFSLGIGAQGETHQAYLFLDNLYRLNRLWSQVRGMYRLNFGWLNLGGSFALPINNTRIQVDEYGVTAAKVWEADLNLIPFSWTRIYASLNATAGYSKYQKYEAGVEIRPVRMVSLTAEYNKTDSHFFSNWHGYEDLRISLNLLLGTQQNDFQQKKNSGTFIVHPSYPMLMARTVNEEDPISQVAQYRTIHCVYHQDITKIISPWDGVSLHYKLYDPEMTPEESEKLGDSEFSDSTRIGYVEMKETSKGSGTWEVDIPHVYIQPSGNSPKHAVRVADGMVFAAYYSPSQIEIEGSKDLDIGDVWLSFRIF